LLKSIKAIKKYVKYNYLGIKILYKWHYGNNNK
jgi:hypothetical protein